MDSAIVKTKASLLDAFEIRRIHFKDDILFYAPGLKKYEVTGFAQKKPNAFLPISLTGSGCALNCDHCDKKILEPMIPLDMRSGLFQMCQNLSIKGTESVLISGGSMKNGMVPILKHLDEMKRVKEELGMKVMVHTGLVNEEMAAGLKYAGVDGVALDIIGDQETIKQIYHLDVGVEDFDQSMELLCKYGLSIRPHIILGLHYGQFKGEYHALEMISRHDVHALIIVIFMPLQGTRMQDVQPPPLEDVEEFLIKSRLKMPDTKILLGCARPGGTYKLKVDSMALHAGINGIAYPAEGIIEQAQQLGLKPQFFENACSCGVS